MTIGENIQYYRKKIGLSQENLASLLYVSRQTISLWETGQTLPTIDNLIRLREIFGTSADAILCENDPDLSEQTSEAVPQQNSVAETEDNKPITVCDFVVSSEKKRKMRKSAYALLITLLSVSILALTLLIIYAALSPFPSFFDGIIIGCAVALSIALITISVSRIIYMRTAVLGERISDERTVCEIRGNQFVINRFVRGFLTSQDSFPVERIKRAKIRGKTIIVTYKNGKIKLDTSLVSDPSIFGEIRKESKFKYKKAAIITVSAILATAIALCAVFVALRILSNPIRKAEKIADIDIPSYIGKNTLKEKSEYGFFKIKHETEIYFTDEYAALIETDISETDKWEKTNEMPAEMLSYFKSATISTASDYYFICDTDGGTYVSALTSGCEYLVLFYLADENILRIAEFKYLPE